MDPISAVGLTASLVGTINIITKSVNSMLALQTRYRQTDLTVRLIIGQLSTLKAALNQICDWITTSLVAVPEHEQLVLDLTTSVESCKVLLLILDDRINILNIDRDGVESLSILSKIRLLWAETESSRYLTHLNNQISALNLFLTASQCRSVHDQTNLLRRNESRRIIHQVKDDTSSLLWLRDRDSCLTRHSIASGSSSTLNDRFEFDREVLNSKAYQVTIRQALSRKRDKTPQHQGPPLNNAIDFIGCEPSNEPEDGAQIIRNTSMSSPPLTDKILNAMKTSSQADCMNPSNSKAEFDSEYSISPKVGLAANDVRKEGGDEDGLPIDKRRPIPKDPSLLDPVLVDQAIVDSSQESSKLPKKNGIQRKQYSDENMIIAPREAEVPRVEAVPLSETTQSPIITDRPPTMNNKSPLKPRVLPSSPIAVEEGYRSVGAEKMAHISSRALLAAGTRKADLAAGTKKADFSEGTKRVHFAPHAALSENQKCPKVLILGISGAGKSTLLQSMTLYNGGTYNVTERNVYKAIIHSNIIDDIAEIISIIKIRDICLDSEDNERHIRRLIRHIRLRPIPNGIADDVALAIQALWDDSNLQACIRTLNEHRLNDSYGYYCNKMSRIASPYYLPTDQDILRSRVITKDVTKNILVVNDFAYSIYDVGGCRLERQNWVHYYENVDVVIYPVDISAYDLYYDEFYYFNDERARINMMTEALQVFESICNSRRLHDKPMILFFNRVDSLQRKLATSPFAKYFPDFDDDPMSLKAVKAYIAMRFWSLHERPEYVQVCFTDMVNDTSLGKAAFAALQRSLKLREVEDSSRT